MATITKETGTGSAISTSYASEADFTAYNAERNVTLGLTNGAADELLILAMDYIETKDFIGTKASKDQALLWPRFGAQLNDYSLNSDEIPVTLIEAQIEIAISIDAGVNPLANIGRETKREKVDVIEVEYTDTAFAQTYITAAERKLSKLVKPVGLSYRV